MIVNSNSRIRLFSQPAQLLRYFVHLNKLPRSQTPKLSKTMTMTTMNNNATTTTTTDQHHNHHRVQKLIFIRHGVAKHNVRDHVTGQGPNLYDPSFLDPPLVYEGKIQGLKAGEQLRSCINQNQHHFIAVQQDSSSTSHGGPPKPELVISSPLTRCFQTTMLVCGPGDIYTTNNSVNSNSQESPSEQQSAEAEEPSYICSELCREAFGMHYPDKRRRLSVLKKYWPIFHFPKEMTEYDDAWRSDQRETIDDVQTRVSKLLEFIVSRSEFFIVVVSHGVFIETLLNTHCPQALQYGQQRVYNCDMYCVDCISNRDITNNSGGCRFIELQNPHKV